MVKVEVCAESIESALTAQEGGAYRVELCDNLAEGGTTPSYGQIIEARECLHIQLYPIIRPRGGDFLYSEPEYRIMRHDVVFCGEAECDGIVIGMLDADGNVDIPRCTELIELARHYGMEVTFHRAFDVAADLRSALEDIIALGCKRVLTSGGAATAEEGLAELKMLVELSNGRIVVMPGSGITPENAERIIRETGCREIHGTFRSRYGSNMIAGKPAWADYDLWHADIEKVQAVVKKADTLNIRNL